MTPGIRPLVAGNWKMNGTGESLTELRAIAAGLSSDFGRKLDAVICVPATLLSRAAETLSGETTVGLGGQDSHFKTSGAHTGDISAEMLKEAGASHVIIGHSERRTDHHHLGLGPRRGHALIPSLLAVRELGGGGSQHAKLHASFHCFYSIPGKPFLPGLGPKGGHAWGAAVKRQSTPRSLVS